MGLPVVENLSGLEESIFSLSRSSQLHFAEKSKKCIICIKYIDFPLSPCLGSLGLLSLKPRFPAVGGIDVKALTSLRVS